MRIRLMLFIFLLKFSISGNAQSTEFVMAENYYKAEKFEKAKPILLSYLKKYPKDKLTREYLGDIASYDKKWDTALGYYEELVKEQSSNANYHFKYGGALGMKALSISRIRALTYIDDIKEHFHKAAELDPNHIETRWALVELYLQLPGIIGGSTSKARDYALELQKISPVDGYLARGYVEEHQNNLKEAEQFYKSAIKVGGSPTTYAKLIALYEKDNEPQKALDAATTSFKIHKRNQINYQIGKIAAEFNIEPVLGLASLKQYIANYSYKDGVPVGWAQYRMAQIYKNQGDKTRALHYINLCLQDLPDFDKAIDEKKNILAM
ncbi:tetratricopeptide repeat protein [Leeuwenhoekiella sp. MAR_2009_132]|uniref:tetratricopeptide repeat protein n=1 Tax=Leeuwenhoekiella sp. MAR_2009_132 TaxID=1392489 RepID=UPI000490D817|nr:tetratricopeptide repeat protein [Leeuwenhoekiella sp. MAR_2009_132]